jgi:hypothetical protein
MKLCSDCKEIKAFSEFSKNRSRPDGYKSVCKECSKIRERIYKRSVVGVIRDIYYVQTRNSKKRNHEPPKYSRIQLHEYLIESTVFIELFNAWKKSGYLKDLKPSIDRIDNLGGYNFSNIQVITWQQNNLKNYSDRKSGRDPRNMRAVLQLSGKGVVLKAFHSISEAARSTGTNGPDIQKVLKDKINKTGGYRWKYKEEK